MLPLHTYTHTDSQTIWFIIFLLSSPLILSLFRPTDQNSSNDRSHCVPPLPQVDPFPLWPAEVIQEASHLRSSSSPPPFSCTGEPVLLLSPYVSTPDPPVVPHRLLLAEISGSVSVTCRECRHSLTSWFVTIRFPQHGDGSTSATGLLKPNMCHY